MSTPTLLAHPDSSVGKRAGFAQHNLWVTPYRADERRAAGNYPNQHEGGDGLPRWTAADRSLVDTDVVVWYTFGAHPHRAPGGLAGHAGGVHRLPAPPVRLLRPQPRARRPPERPGHCHRPITRPGATRDHVAATHVALRGVGS